MAKATTEILVGGGTLYVAPFGTAFPTDAETAPAVDWVDVGYTEDGAVLDISQTFTDVEVDELTYPVESSLDATEASLSAELAQFTLANLKTALNGGTITAIPGPPVRNTYTPPAAADVVAVAALFRFTNENGFSTDLQMPKVTNVSTISSTFKNRGATKSLIPVELKMLEQAGVPAFTFDEYVSAT